MFLRTPTTIYFKDGEYNHRIIIHTKSIICSFAQVGGVVAGSKVRIAGFDIFFLGGGGVAGVEAGETPVNLLLANADSWQLIIRREIYFQAIHNGFGYCEAKVKNVLGSVSFGDKNHGDFHPDGRIPSGMRGFVRN